VSAQGDVLSDGKGNSATGGSDRDGIIYSDPAPEEVLLRRLSDAE
jgi:hypothetical protein